MGVISTADQELADTVRHFLGRRGARAAARAALEGGAVLPPFWKEIAELGWLGIHLPEGDGGAGFGLAELAIVAEEFGRECTPGPFLPVVVAAGAISACGTTAQRDGFLPGLVGGDVVAGLGLAGTLAVDGEGTLTGDACPVLGGATADILVLAVGDDLALLDRQAQGVTVEERANLDPTRPCASVRCERVRLPAERLVPGAAARARQLLRVLAAAEAAGGAATCRIMATSFAGGRVAFGRPIGQFQAVKHKCADMFVDEQLAMALARESARADDAADDNAARSLVGHAALAIALPAFLDNAKRSIQVHGGMGFTWEHDAHLFLRRAGALTALAGPVDESCATVGRLSGDVAWPRLRNDLPPGAKHHREAARQFAAAYWAAEERDRDRLLVESGYLFPHWPKPWGRAADPLEQLIIEDELADIPPPALELIWMLPIVLPTIMVHGTEDQQQRWIRPSIDGDLTWCQLFSEPGAGSDLAALATRATRTDGGWSVTGQKIWTSYAHQADLGLALVRTGSANSRHFGITCMVVDMGADGVTVRPLRQLTGSWEFNEVFLDEVFVPDDHVVGAVNRGWAIARTTLNDERIFMAGGVDWDHNEDCKVVQRMALDRAGREPQVLIDLGRLIATDRAAQALTTRAVELTLAGVTSFAEGNVTKLVSAELAQRVADFGLRLLGCEGAFADRDATTPAAFFLYARRSTIAGGTSEIVRNVIAERALGLPTDG